MVTLFLSLQQSNCQLLTAVPTLLVAPRRYTVSIKPTHDNGGLRGDDRREEWMDVAEWCETHKG